MAQAMRFVFMDFHRGSGNGADGRPGCSRKNLDTRRNPMAELTETEISNKKLAA